MEEGIIYKETLALVNHFSLGGKCRKPYAATQHPMLLMLGVCTQNM